VEHHSHYHTRHGEDKNKDQGHVIGGFKSWVLSSCHILFLPLVPPVPIGVKLGVNIRLMIVPWATQIPRKKPRNTLGKNWRRWALMLSDSQIVDGNMMEVRFCRSVAAVPLCRYCWTYINAEVTTRSLEIKVNSALCRPFPSSLSMPWHARSFLVY
jgi:hypothetical protein